MKFNCKEMSVLKLQINLRVVNSKCQKSQLYLTTPICSEKVTFECNSIRQNGTLTTTKTDKKENASNSTSDASAQTVKKSSVKLLSLGVTVPLKFAEFNKYLNEATKKLRSLYSTKEGIHKHYTQHKDETQASSLETTVSQINQSIVAFYDTTKASPAPRVRTVGSAPYSTLNKDSSEDEHNLGESPQMIGPLFPLTPSTEAKKQKAEARRAEKISRLSLESRTKSLVQSLKGAHSLMSKMTRTEEFCEHLIAHPECVWDASKEKVLPCLLRLSTSPDKHLRGLALEALSLIGYCKPLSSPGIRILSIDGGGTRGLVTIEFLKALEKQSQRKIYQLFDYVCGVSTGALLAAMICLYKIPLERCEQLYKDCSVQMFTRNRVVGTTKLVLNHGFYDSHSWEEILKKEIGERLFIEFSRDPDVPKMSAVSSLASAPQLTNYLFRTYNLPPGATSQYPGGCHYKIWEVIRASSAAPGYFEAFVRGNEIHEDGGISANNPTALAIHESRLLWPKENFHCVVSLGTGRFESSKLTPGKVSLKRRFSNLVDSATDTESVHQTLQDLLQPRTYFRFNPYLTEECNLDEIRAEKMSQMQLDAQMYTRRNSYKLTAAAERLTEKRKPQQYLLDAVRKVIDQY
ncbi:calcium-independent phospholipase A2-gamma-like [Physella acuta]|uniref:calcium-independent phospholipase A2-gamma-like n=1 Tax=Physella acuta TaxID=109671 RepID=UPI0027DAC925|nr:calcium-independent phospholipase A2-gamma-like [Physella acuta]